MDTKTIRIIYHEEPEGWWADSPDIPGWSAAGSSYPELRATVVEGIAFASGEPAAEVHHFVPADSTPGVR